MYQTRSGSSVYFIHMVFSFYYGSINGQPSLRCGVPANGNGGRMDAPQQVIMAVQPVLRGLRLFCSRVGRNAPHNIEQAWMLRGVKSQGMGIDRRSRTRRGIDGAEVCPGERARRIAGETRPVGIGV